MTRSGTRVCPECKGSGIFQGTIAVIVDAFTNFEPHVRIRNEATSCAICHGTGYLLLEPKPKPYLGAPRANPKPRHVAEGQP